MDYTRLYNTLISHRRTNILCKSKELYTENHHVIPRCLGGTDEKENLVRLTAREHFLAHRLLLKIHPDSHGLLTAVAKMLHNHGNKISSSREVERLRVESSKRQSEMMKELWSDGEWREMFMGIITSEETRNKLASSMTEERIEQMRLRMTGEGNHCFGKYAEDHPAFGHKKSQEFKDKISKLFLEYHNRPEVKKKMSELMKEYWSVDENRKRASEAKMGEKNPNYGKNISASLSEEVRLKRNQSVGEAHRKRFPPESYPVDSPKHEYWERADLLAHFLKRTNGKLTSEVLRKSYGKTGMDAWNTAGTICTRIKRGWKPLEDQRWLDYVEERSKLVSPPADSPTTKPTTKKLF